MRNPFAKNEINPIVPLLIGVAVGGVIALLLAPDSGSGLRSTIADNAKKGWDSLKENLPFSSEDLDNIKNKVVDKVKSTARSQVEHAGNMVAGNV
jgi:gas vesicle protein